MMTFSIPSTYRYAGMAYVKFSQLQFGQQASRTIINSLIAKTDTHSSHTNRHYSIAQCCMFLVMLHGDVLVAWSLWYLESHI